MALPLPPKSIIRCDDQIAQDVHHQLTLVIAGHAQAFTTYQFYEELDAWLGPWGQQGYPIAYGKFYNIAFTTNKKLMANPNAKDWVWRTTILLQEALRDYIVFRVKNCSLSSITEAQLRHAAFSSHPVAYDQAGLAMLTLVAPDLIPVIATIPGREFSPGSDNFGSTIMQAFSSLMLITPQLVQNSLGALAGPAHTGILRRAVRMDQQHFFREISLARELRDIKSAIERGELDYIPVLDKVIKRLNTRQFPDQGFAMVARQVVQAAEERRQKLVQRTDLLLKQSPPVRARVEAAFPDLLRPIAR